MNSPQILHENSKRLKKFFALINPAFGDPQDPNRFLLSVNGMKKAYLPTSMKSIPLIQKLIDARSLSKFLRSRFFNSNFHSVSQLFATFKNIRLKYDFLYWIGHKYPSQIPFKEFRSLLSELQSIRWSGKPTRIIIRKNSQQDISAILNLFVIWFKEYGKPNSNVMIVSHSESDSRLNKEFFLNLKDNSHFPHFKFKKTGISSSIFQPTTKSKFWFTSASHPERCRSLDFSFLFFNDLHKWNDSGKFSANKVIQATFPVIPNSNDSAIIMEAGPLKRNRFLRQEFMFAQENISGFNYMSIPWHHNHYNMYKFDFPEDKILFYKNLMKFKNRKKLPHFPNANPTYLYSLWTQGLPLEAIHWYAAESSFFKSPTQFQNLYPPNH
ncbi:MAG: hypothetical protein J1E16_00720 [Muribaculaceae bacterium]|nr:hypothetical protein [Muribaculaceae bacterium]